jgi:hypothetical protein
MISEKNIEMKLNPSTLTVAKTNNEKHSGRVDINHLLARVRDKKHQENKINFIFFALFCSLILVVGIILSF